MNPEKNVTWNDVDNLRKTQSYQDKNKEIEYFERQIKLEEPTITQEEDEQLTLEKRMEEADDREADLANGWVPEL